MYKDMRAAASQETARHRGWLLANSQQETEAFDPIAHKDLNAANNHMSLKADATPVEPPHEITNLVDTLLVVALWDLEAEDPAPPDPNS